MISTIRASLKARYKHPAGPQPITVDTGRPHVFPFDVVIFVACYVLCLFVTLAISHSGV